MRSAEEGVELSEKGFGAVVWAEGEWVWWDGGGGRYWRRGDGSGGQKKGRAGCSTGSGLSSEPDLVSVG